MLVKVLRGFPYAADGIRIVQVDAGTDADIRDDLLPGLIAEGYVAVLEPEKAAPPSVDERAAGTGSGGEKLAANDIAPGSEIAEAQTASGDPQPEHGAPAPTSADGSETSRKPRSRR